MSDSIAIRNDLRSLCGASRGEAARSSRTLPAHVSTTVATVRASEIEYHPEHRMPDLIRFYSTTDEYGEFSNFAAYPIVIGKQEWPTSEHYFQAQKFADKADQEEIRRAKSPMLAAQMGRDRRRKLRRDWESVKVQVMRAAVLAKFSQHDDLRLLLLSTGEAKIVEHTGNDDYWGDGGDGSGKNQLGRILMEVRDRLRTIK